MTGKLESARLTCYVGSKIILNEAFRVEQHHTVPVSRWNQSQLLTALLSLSLGCLPVAGCSKQTPNGCEDIRTYISSQDEISAALYTHRVCDYGFGSSSQEFWLDIIKSPARPDSRARRVFQISGDLGADGVRWLDDNTLEVGVSRPARILRSLGKSEDVTISYAILPSRSVGSGQVQQAAAFASWVKKTLIKERFSAAAACEFRKSGSLNIKC